MSDTVFPERSRFDAGCLGTNGPDPAANHFGDGLRAVVRARGGTLEPSREYQPRAVRRSIGRDLPDAEMVYCERSSGETLD